jgi:hypothetical protein
MADDVDWQKVANERARITKKGTPDPKTAHITDQVPFGGYYRYKTNPNMTGEWLIGGDMRVNRILTDDEVKAINDAAGVSDLPRREGYAGRGRVVGDVVDKALKLVTGAEEPATTGIRAYHGSPHDFAAESALRAFAETKLKTPKGKPMRLYHLTPGNFSEFSVSPENRSGPVVFLSPYADFQPAYHQAAERGPNDEITSIFKEGANVMPVYADVRNPLILDSNEKIKEAQAKYQSGDRGFPYFVKPEAKAAMEADGYDGIIFGGNNPAPYRSETFTEGWNPHIGFQQNREEEIIVFDPQKVKSAISNTGKYDFTNPDITKAGGGSTSGPQRSMDKNISILGAMNVARGIIGGK